MLRLRKKASTPSMSVQQAQEYTANSSARADADLARATRKAAEAEAVIAELRRHGDRLEQQLIALLFTPDEGEDEGQDGPQVDEDGSQDEHVPRPVKTCPDSSPEAEPPQARTVDLKAVLHPQDDR